MAFFKAVIYSSVFFGLGYGFLKFAQYNEEKVIRELETTSEPKSDAEKKRKLMMDVLKKAAENKAPIDKIIETSRIDK